jgi:hypothetical protein
VLPGSVARNVTAAIDAFAHRSETKLARQSRILHMDLGSGSSMYEYYSLHCKALSNGRYCAKIFGLPGSTLLSEEEYENPPSQPKWPSAEWKAHVACPLCGCIREYGFADMDWWHDEERLLGDFFLHVKMECSKSDCHVPVEFYIVDFDVIAHGDDWESFDLPHHREKWIAETDWVKLIRSGKFHGVCNRGHELQPIPAQRYNVSTRQGFLPSQHDMLGWGRVVS